jgi:hypothetical protein
MVIQDVSVVQAIGAITNANLDQSLKIAQFLSKREVAERVADRCVGRDSTLKHLYYHWRVNHLHIYRGRDIATIKDSLDASAHIFDALLDP